MQVKIMVQQKKITVKQTTHAVEERDTQTEVTKVCINLAILSF